MRDVEPLHQSGLRGLAQFQGKRLRTVQHLSSAEFERSHQGKGQRDGARVAAHIGARAGLVEVKWRIRRAIGIEGAALKVECAIANAPSLQSGEQWLLPFGVFEEDNQVEIHARGILS